MRTQAVLPALQTLVSGGLPSPRCWVWAQALRERTRPLSPPHPCPPDRPEPRAQLRWCRQSEEPAPSAPGLQPSPHRHHQESSDRGPGPGGTRLCSWQPVTWDERSQGRCDVLEVAKNSLRHPRGAKAVYFLKTRRFLALRTAFLRATRSRWPSLGLCLGRGREEGGGPLAFLRPRHWPRRGPPLSSREAGRDHSGPA